MSIGEGEADVASMERRIRDSFAAQGFMSTIGATLVSVGAGAVEVRLPVRPLVGQQHGFVHAGAISAIADSAAGYAAMSLLKAGAEVLTVEFKINLLVPAQGEYLIARARSLRSGRRITVSACDVLRLRGRRKGASPPCSLPSHTADYWTPGPRSTRA